MLLWSFLNYSFKAAKQKKWRKLLSRGKFHTWIRCELAGLTGWEWDAVAGFCFVVMYLMVPALKGGQFWKIVFLYKDGWLVGLLVGWFVRSFVRSFIG